VTRKQQKNCEIAYAEKAGELLGEQWKIDAPPEEENWPDLLVTTSLHQIGLEVTEIYLDETRKGSQKKAYESKNQKAIETFADSYYDAGGSPVSIQFLGNLDRHNLLPERIIEEVSQLAELERKRIEIARDCVVSILKLPSCSGEYRRWVYVSDRVGYVGRVDKFSFDKVIEKKAKNLPKYTANVSEVALLMVSNRIFNSGKFRLDGSTLCDPRGFCSVFYLSYPEEAWRLYG